MNIAKSLFIPNLELGLESFKLLREDGKRTTNTWTFPNSGNQSRAVRVIRPHGKEFKWTWAGARAFFHNHKKRMMIRLTLGKSTTSRGVPEREPTVIANCPVKSSLYTRHASATIIPGKLCSSRCQVGKRGGICPGLELLVGDPQRKVGTPHFMGSQNSVKITNMTPGTQVRGLD